ncbi:hypothetical protein ACWGJX_45860 [Streptomyces sp. NPDC054775]
MVSNGDVAEVCGDVTGAPEPAGLFVQLGQDPVTATLGKSGVPVVAGGDGELGAGLWWLEDGDVEVGDGVAGVGRAVGVAGAVAGDR